MIARRCRGPLRLGSGQAFGAKGAPQDRAFVAETEQQVPRRRRRCRSDLLGMTIAFSHEVQPLRLGSGQAFGAKGAPQDDRAFVAETNSRSLDGAVAVAPTCSG
jgi:hypothetical protein